MSTGGEPAAHPHSHLDPKDRYKVGTLQYTKVGLVMVFFWLLWGDFTFSLMETIAPSILPLKMQKLGASNVAMSIILVTIPSIMNLLVNPVVSFRSDRFRSRWGRRIPFLFFATPPITICLIVMAFSPDIGQWLFNAFGGRLHGMGVTTVIVVTIGVVMVMFQFFNMIIGSIYYYLFNDVVPEHFVSRFMGLFRMVGAMASMTYNWFIFQHALTHMREIFIGISLVYFVAFMLMCWRVKEGKYPPPPPLLENRKGFRASVKTYCKESYSHPFYLCTFAFAACLQLAGACNFARNLFFLHLGISLEQLGHFGFYMTIPSVVLMFPLAWLSDKFHPVRVVFWAVLLMPFINVLSFFYVHDFKSMVVMSLVSFPDSMFYVVAVAPLGMLIWPKERYGQFGSADAVVRSLATIAMAPVAGLFLDFMGRVYHGNEEYYRWLYIWAAFFQCLAFVFIFIVYWYWRKHGGMAYFTPPSVGPVSGEEPAAEKENSGVTEAPEEAETSSQSS